MTNIPEKLPLSWLNEQINNDERFAAEALAIRQRISSYQPEHIRETHSTASSAVGLLNHWLVNRDLCAYERGRLIDDFAALTVVEYDGCQMKGIANRQSFIDIKRDELVALIEREGMTVPVYLGGVPAKAKTSTINKTTTRKHVLDPIIKKAKAAAVDPDNYLSVWPQLVEIARSANRPKPLTGYAEDEGVLYETENNPCKPFTKDALRKKMDPNAR